MRSVMKPVLSIEADQGIGDLLSRVGAAEEVTITRYGRPLARLRPMALARPCPLLPGMTPERRAMIEQLAAVMCDRVPGDHMRPAAPRDDLYDHW